MDQNNREYYSNHVNNNRNYHKNCTQVFQLNNNNNTISTLLSDGSDKKKVARKRWAILAKALKVHSKNHPL